MVFDLGQTVESLGIGLISAQPSTKFIHGKLTTASPIHLCKNSINIFFGMCEIQVSSHAADFTAIQSTAVIGVESHENRHDVIILELCQLERVPGTGVDVYEILLIYITGFEERLVLILKGEESIIIAIIIIIHTKSIVIVIVVRLLLLTTIKRTMRTSLNKTSWIRVRMNSKRC